MAELVFYDTNHEYRLNGEIVPSVSELTRFVSREIYGTISQFTLDRAAERGTAVHKATEVLDKYGSAEIGEDVVDYVKAYVQFRKEHVCEWQKIEWATHHPDGIYAGTLDRYGTVDGKKTILDIKTTCTIHKPLVNAQLNLYRKMLPPDDVEQLIILQLRKDGTYKIHNVPIEDGIADACITLHEALKKKTRKRKDKTDEK